MASVQPIIIPDPFTNVSILGTLLNLGTLPNIPDGATDSTLFTLSSSYYPTVGKTYMITMGFTFDITFNGTASGSVNLGLGYYTGSVNYNQASRSGNYCNDANLELYGTVSLTFTHTSNSNSVKIITTNVSGQQINGGQSAILITSLSIQEIPFPSATTFLTNPFT